MISGKNSGFTKFIRKNIRIRNTMSHRLTAAERADALTAGSWFNYLMGGKDREL